MTGDDLVNDNMKCTYKKKYFNACKYLTPFAILNLCIALNEILEVGNEGKK